MPASTNWCIVCRRTVSRVLGAYFLPYWLAAKSMIGVMPMSGLPAFDQGVFEPTLTNASNVSADRSFCCARGSPNAARISSASVIRFFAIGKLAIQDGSRERVLNQHIELRLFGDSPCHFFANPF